MNDNKHYLKKRKKSLGHAFAGVAIFFQETPHAKIHLFAAAIVVGFGLFFKVSTTEWIILLLCIAIVWVLEALNSAIEYVVDLVEPTYHLLAKKAKDVSAAAVLLFSAFAAFIAAIIFFPKIWLVFFS